MSNKKAIVNGPSFKDTDDLRKELQTNIDKKLATSHFQWIITGLCTAFIILIGCLYKEISTTQQVNESTSTKVAVINDKVKELDNKLNIKY